MKIFATILFSFFLAVILPHNSIAGKLFLQKIKDTPVVQAKVEEKVIEEVIESKKPLKKEKVEYLSQVTKYGFKNLFSNYTYNALMPYSSQVNPYAETYMQDYLNSHKKSLEKLKQTGLTYFNFIDGILTQYGLPKELKYLAVIESDLKANALSSAGARGPWQFMIYTARDYGLRVNDYVDDRTDYYKSTNAAAKYLLNLYKDLKDWLLVIAAYNGGPGRVYSAIKKSGSRNFWDLQYYLPEESRNHVKKFIATHYVMESGNYNPLSGKNPNVNFGDNSSSEVVLGKENISSLAVSGRYKAAIIARNIDMEISEFNKFNPGFDNALANGSEYNLQLPDEKMTLFIANKYPILNECVQQLLGNTEMNLKTVYKKRK
jgi:membrane-bound lytic murein transglycosylase D